MTPGDIPIFDLNGPAFLAFYAILFVVATVWSFLRARTSGDSGTSGCGGGSCGGCGGGD